MRLFVAAGVASLLLAAAPTVASAQGWGGEAAFAKVGDLEGAELGVGYALAAGPVSLTPTVGLLVYQGENDRYRMETTSAGTEVCRDHNNGQFADKELCDNSEYKAYGKLEASYNFSQGSIGVGGRFGDEATAYLVGALKVSEGFALHVNAGADFIAFGGRLGF